MIKNRLLGRLGLTLVGMICVVVLPAGAALAAAPITVGNFTDGQTIGYPVPLLEGSLADTSATTVSVTNANGHADERTIAGLADNGRFKALTELTPGVNKLTITANGKSIPFTLTYKPQTNPHFIRAVLFVDNTGNTNYDTPVPNDPQDYRDKYDATFKLLQSFTAEWMNNYGYGRRTFNIETDPNGKVIVHVVKGKHPAAYYQYEIRDRGQLYNTVSSEVAAALPKAQSVDCVLIAFSKLDLKTGKSVAYTALGGGKIALFGGACMYSFPDSIADIQKSFLNPTVIDHKRYVSDSVKRYTMWATASTSIGAIMHEIGHSMGLPHSDDPRDIMTRGIDNLGRNFVFYDPPSLRNKDAIHFKDDQVGYWSPVSAAALAPTVWLAMDDTAIYEKPKGKITVELSPDGKNIIVKSPDGIGFLGYEKPGIAHHFIHIDQSAMPTELTIPVATVKDAEGKGHWQLRIIDGKGQRTQVRLAELSPSFVRAWQMAPKAAPWTNGKSAPEMTPDQLQSLTRTLAQQPLTQSPGARINLRQHYPDAPSRTAAYVMRTIKSPEKRSVKLLTGSDDGLRVWLNGKLVVSELKPRAARVDTDSTPVTLQAGDNQLVVEVTDTGGAWALYLRLTDADGKLLQLTDAGALEPLQVPAE
jgi:hypothetical protein